MKTNWIKAVSFACGLYAFFSGSITLIGWVAGIPRLTDWTGSGISMFANTALMSLCAGAALMLRTVHRKRFEAACVLLGAVTALIGALTFFQHVSGISLGIDTVLITPLWGNRAAAAAGRPGPPASVSFTLIGLGILLAASGRRWRKAVPFLGLATAMISLLSVLGYMFKAEMLFSAPRLTGIAWQTATVILSLSAGLLALVPDREPVRTLLQTSSAGLIARRALPFVILLPIVLGWLRRRGQDLGWFDSGMGLALLLLSLIALLCSVLWWCVAAVSRHEKELKASEQRMRKLINALPAAVYTTDPQGRVTLFNEAAVNIAGRRPRIGRDSWCISWKLYRPDGTPLSREQCPMATALREGRPIRGQELILEKPDGSRVHAIPYPTPLRDSRGTVIGGVNMLVDITEHKEFEARLAKTNAQLKDLTSDLEKRVRERTTKLEEQSEQLRQLAVQLTEAEEHERKRLAQILHDHLQQLLVAAQMRLGLMARRAPGDASLDEARSYIEEACRASRTLTAELRPPVLYEGGLGPALRFLARKFRDQYRLEVHLSYDPESEPSSAPLKTMIYQSIQEILMNTVKYARVDQCAVQLSRLADKMLQVTVMDEGAGFHPETIGKKDSTGFGLFSIRERVKALGGNCSIDSSPGAGTRFRMCIPDIVSEEPQPARRIHVPGTKMKDGKKGASITVLLADDHKIVRQSLAQLLGAMPFIHAVLEAEDGKEAVELAAAESPDLVLMDLNMPNMNGIEATKLLTENYPDIKIIGLSVQSEPETVQAMKDAGAIGYFNKGEDIDNLLEALRGLVPTENPPLPVLP